MDGLEGVGGINNGDGAQGISLKIRGSRIQAKKKGSQGRREPDGGE
jgi:hypothetical protein